MRLKTPCMLLVITLLLLYPATGVSAAGEDWVLVRVTSGSLGAAGVGVNIQVRGVGTNASPVVVGTATMGNYGRFISVSPIGDDSVSLTSTQSLGGLNINLLPGTTTRFDAKAGLTNQELLAGRSVAVLLFAANASFESVEVSHSARIGSITVEQRRGSGSTAMLVTRTEGTALGAGPLTGGSVTYSASVGRGLVGAINTDCHCFGEWSGPGGRGSLWQGLGVSVADTFNEEFLGPTGDWSWSWHGTSDPYLGLFIVGPTVIGAYAPVGDDWTLFEEQG